MGHCIEDIYLHIELPDGDKTGPGVDVTVAKVATVSEHAFDAPRKGLDLVSESIGDVHTKSHSAGSSRKVLPVSTPSRPDRATYDVEQRIIETEIGSMNERLVRRVSLTNLKCRHSKQYLGCRE